ncbi:MMPL family transporter [Conexibacter sp. W3-3-2]|uniref:MMPL family transporter n=1 Tax=Conexibacter sp. W3-3-2 TaxID=2675227 RepID=UPI0012BA0688|nr:MMPL family transporter [Conexibacter sp. W3-3-2]MTD45906.1 MMPL family transporter [Conexibacter sp. W3-3-2]
MAFASQLGQVSSAELLVAPTSEVGRAQTALDRGFGAEPIVVSLRADLSQTLSSRNIGRLLELEGKIARADGVRAVYGPATFLNQTIARSEDVLRRELGDAAGTAKTAADRARRKARKAGASAAVAEQRADEARVASLGPKAAQYQELMVRLGSVGFPSLVNQNYINTVIFGTGVEPKLRFRWLFPDTSHALVVVRPDPGLGEQATLALGREIGSLIKAAKLDDVRANVGGFPLVAAALERETRSEILRLAPIAVGAMMMLLLLTLRRRRGRFVPLGLALGSTALATGLSWPLGLGLSVSTVAALPVVLGLALDFAVQLQARFWHERHAGLAAPDAALEARAAVGPTLALAAGAMSIGFLVLVATSVPLLDRLGVFLALGTVSSVTVVLLVGPALLTALDRGLVEPLGLPRRAPLAGAALRPGALAVLVGLSAGGLALSGQTRLESDLRTLSPAGMAELKGVEDLQRELGTSGQVRLAVRGRDVTDPAVVTWMGEVRDRVVEADPRLSPGPNLADLAQAGDTTTTLDRRSVDGVLNLLPRYFVDAVITPDRKLAELSFGIPFVSVEEQGRIVDQIREAADGAPSGTTVTASGLVAAAAASTDSLESTRPGLLLLAAALMAGVLFGFWRDWRRVAIVLGPALLAAGIAALVLLVVDLQLSPLGAALEPLVLAVGLEFGMLLDMRYRQARQDGRSPVQARRETTIEIVPAVMLSASTVAVGFAVLMASRLPLLSQLGWLVALELALCVVAAVLTVPALAERFDRGVPAGELRLPAFADRVARRLTVRKATS